MTLERDHCMPTSSRLDHCLATTPWQKNFSAFRETKEKDAIKSQNHIYASAGKTVTLHSYLFLIALWDICQCYPCFCVIPEHRMAASIMFLPAELH